METDADQCNGNRDSETEGMLATTSCTIKPGSFMVVEKSLQTFVNFQFYDPQRAQLDDETNLLLRHESRIMRRKRDPRRSSVFQKYNSLANERKLRFAASTSNIELLCEMLDRGTSPNCSDEHKRSPLHLAACRGYGDIITMLLQHGANPNIIDSLGNTPLHLSVISASSKKFNNVVRILLNHGASVHVTDRTGRFLE